MSTNSREHSVWTEQDHQAVRDMLPEYATTVAQGLPPSLLAPAIAAHLAACPACRELFDAVLELTTATFESRLPPAPEQQEPDLGFLQRAGPARSSAPAALGRLIVRFSRELLQSLAPPMAVRSGGQQLYRYGVKPAAQPDLQVQIEVFHHPAEPTLSRIEITVEVTTREPLDQAESTVILRYDDVEQQRSTDELGCSIFEAVPLAALPALEIEVVPCRSAESAAEP